MALWTDQALPCLAMYIPAVSQFTLRLTNDNLAQASQTGLSKLQSLRRLLHVKQPSLDLVIFRLFRG